MLCSINLAVSGVIILWTVALRKKKVVYIIVNYCDMCLGFCFLVDCRLFFLNLDEKEFGFCFQIFF